MQETGCQVAAANSALSVQEVGAVVAKACSSESYRGKRILLIVPDGTRTAPIGMVFQALFGQIGSVAKALDVLIALGTHQPMSEEAICQRLEISLENRKTTFNSVGFFNHAWD